jgi:hypothetical protein
MSRALELFNDAVEAFEHSNQVIDADEFIKDVYAVCLSSLKSINHLCDNNLDEANTSLYYWYLCVQYSDLLPFYLDKWLLGQLSRCYSYISIQDSLTLSSTELKEFGKMAKDCLYCANEVLKQKNIQTNIKLNLEVM